MKKVKMFGKSVPLIAIVLAGLLTFTASAVLVDYLSNTVTSDVTVTSPMVARILISNRTDWATAQRWRHDQAQLLDAFPEGNMSATGPYVGFGDVGGWTYSDWAETVTVEIMGGETITLYLMSECLADATIVAHEEFRIYNPDGISSDDFVSMSVRYDSIYGDHGYGTLYPDGTDWYGDAPYPWSNATGIEVLLPDNTSTWTGETDVSQWQITFNAAASGTYTFSYRITPELVTPP